METVPQIYRSLNVDSFVIFFHTTGGSNNAPSVCIYVKSRFKGEGRWSGEPKCSLLENWTCFGCVQTCTRSFIPKTAGSLRSLSPLEQLNYIKNGYKFSTTVSITNQIAFTAAVHRKNIRGGYFKYLNKCALADRASSLAGGTFTPCGFFRAVYLHSMLNCCNSWMLEMTPKRFPCTKRVTLMPDTLQLLMWDGWSAKSCLYWCKYSSIPSSDIN